MSKDVILERATKGIEEIERAREDYYDLRIAKIMKENEDRTTWLGKPNPMDVEEAEAVYERRYNYLYNRSKPHENIYGAVLMSFKALKDAASDPDVVKTMNISLKDYANLTNWTK